MSHVDEAKRSLTPPREKGDDRRAGARLLEALPEACARLEVFQWEWVRAFDDGGREWVEAKGKPVSCPYPGVNEEGLADAAIEVARWVQVELRARGEKPLELGDAIDLWMLRLGYVNALYWLDGDSDELWKAVEAEVAPKGGAPLSICIGSDRRIGVQVLLHGRPRLETMYGYRGCLRTFPVKPHGRGRPWATWCPDCRPRKSNQKQKAITEFQRRTAAIGQPAAESPTAIE